jgi:HSP20 family molecular chaperone IbpA
MSVNLVSRILLNNLKQQKLFKPIVGTNRLIHQNRNRFDDSFFGVASNLMRSLENEFNQMRNSLLRSPGLPALPPIQRLFELPTFIERPPTSEDLIAVDDQGNRKFQLQVDLKGFEPEEINVETKGNLLVINAKKEKKVFIIFVKRF